MGIPPMRTARMAVLRSTASTIPLTREKLRHYRTRLLIFLAILGPGIITANVDNDAGGIYTYSVAGAQYGFSLLWTLIPITVALVIVQEMVARMGVVTGKGLADLIREEYGLRTTFILMVLLIITNLGNTVSEFAGLASGMSVFGMSRFVAVPLGALFVWLLVVKGSYRYVEKVFLAACVIYIAYPVSCFLARPDWTSSLISTFKPSFHFTAGYLYMTIGLVGQGTGCFVRARPSPQTAVRQPTAARSRMAEAMMNGRSLRMSRSTTAADALGAAGNC